MILDHFGFDVADYERAKTFYQRALAPLGISVAMEIPQRSAAGFGRNGKPDFWIEGRARTAPPFHLAFRAENREQVRAFHAAALAAGGTDNGPPGLRPMYHSDYYAAFVFDLDGHNIEAVCHEPERA